MSNFKSFIRNYKLEIRNCKFKNGFTFIELLIVIALMAIVGASVSAAYLGFERNQRIKEAREIVKSAVRQAQNSALSGKTNCVSPYKLAGWYFVTTVGSGTLAIEGECISSISRTAFSVSIFRLPAGVTVSGISYGSVPISGTVAYVVFRPLSEAASFHSDWRFVDLATGDLAYLFGTVPQDALTMTLSSVSGSSTVVVYPSGGVK